MSGIRPDNDSTSRIMHMKNNHINNRFNKMNSLVLAQGRSKRRAVIPLNSPAEILNLKHTMGQLALEEETPLRWLFLQGPAGRAIDGITGCGDPSETFQAYSRGLATAAAVSLGESRTFFHPMLDDALGRLREDRTAVRCR